MGILSQKQNIPTENANAYLTWLLDYCETRPNAKIQYYESYMILNIHADALYLSEQKARNTAGGQYLLGKLPQNNQPIFLNGTFHTLANMIDNVASSAVEAEIGSLFLNAKKEKEIRLALEEMGHPKPPTLIDCDNSAEVVISNGTDKKKRSRAMDMRYFWVMDKVKQGKFNIIWDLVQENLADYVTNHFPASHHHRVRTYYVHMSVSLRCLSRDLPLSALQGCVDPYGSTANTYVGRAPLPRVSSRTHRAIQTLSNDGQAR